MNSEIPIDALRDQLMARYAPIDALETHWVEHLLSVIRRQRLLDEMEMRVLEEGMVHGAGRSRRGWWPAIPAHDLPLPSPPRT